MPTILTRAEAASLQATLDRITPAEALALAQAQCAADGWFWLQYVQTRDEADPEVPVKMFPRHLSYIRGLWDVLTNKPRVVVAKSRQMMVSWEVVALPEGGFEGRAQFIESHLPDWLRLPAKISEGRIQYPNGSMIQALAGGADKVRGLVPSVFVGDEFAHQEEQDGVYTAVAPLMQKGAKVVFVSTPNGASNVFATLYHGRPVGTDPTI